MGEHQGRPAVRPAIRARYCLLGLIVAGMWLWSSGQPLWLHALRILAILLVVPAVAGRVVAAAARRRGTDPGQMISVARLVAFKDALVLVAGAATLLLRNHVAHLDLWVAAWLALMLAFGGPAIHHRLLKGPPRPSCGIRRRDIAIAIVAAGVVTALAGGEIIARQAIEAAISRALRPSVSGTISVGIGRTPALADLVKGSISTVSVDAVGMRTCKLGDITFDAALHDVTRPGRQVRTSSSQATIIITPDALAAALARTSQQFSRVLVTPDTSQDSLAVGLGPAGVLVVDERPAISGDAVRFTPVRVLVNGSSAPPPLAQRIAARLTFMLTFPPLPMQVTPRTVQVDQDGVVLTATGGPATFGPGSRAAARKTCG